MTKNLFDGGQGISDILQTIIKYVDPDFAYLKSPAAAEHHGLAATARKQIRRSMCCKGSGSANQMARHLPPAELFHPSTTGAHSGNGERAHDGYLPIHRERRAEPCKASAAEVDY